MAFDVFAPLDFGTPGINGPIAQSQDPYKDLGKPPSGYKSWSDYFNQHGGINDGTPSGKGDKDGYNGTLPPGTPTSDPADADPRVGSPGDIATGGLMTGTFLDKLGIHIDAAEIAKFMTGIFLYGVLVIALVEFIKPGLASDVGGQVSDGAKEAAKAVIAE